MKKIVFLAIILLIASLGSFINSQNTQNQDYINNIKKQISEIESKIPTIKNPVNEYIKIAHLYTEIEDLDNAAIYFEKALSLEPTNANIYFKLAMIYEKKKNYAKAIDYWEKCLKYSQNKQISDIARKHINFLREMK